MRFFKSRQRVKRHLQIAPKLSDGKPMEKRAQLGGRPPRIFGLALAFARSLKGRLRVFFCDLRDFLQKEVSEYEKKLNKLIESVYYIFKFLHNNK